MEKKEIMETSAIITVIVITALYVLCSGGIGLIYWLKRKEERVKYDEEDGKEVRG